MHEVYYSSAAYHDNLLHSIVVFMTSVLHDICCKHKSSLLVMYQVVCPMSKHELCLCYSLRSRPGLLIILETKTVVIFYIRKVYLNIQFRHFNFVTLIYNYMNFSNTKVMLIIIIRRMKYYCLLFLLLLLLSSHCS